MAHDLVRSATMTALRVPSVPNVPIVQDVSTRTQHEDRKGQEVEKLRISKFEFPNVSLRTLCLCGEEFYTLGLCRE